MHTDTIENARTPRSWRPAYRDLLINLVSKEIKVRYMGAWLGFGWSLANPVLTTLTYYAVFTFIFPNNHPHFALYVMTGVLHWGFFSQIIAQSPDWLLFNAALLKKIRFPRLLVVAASFLTGLTFWAAALTVYWLAYAPLGGVFRPVLLLYPVYLAMFCGLTFGIALLLSVAYVFFRDLKHLIEVVLGLLFWVTPIVYLLPAVPPAFAHWIQLNPLVPFFNCFHALLYDGLAPSRGQTVYAAAACGAALLLGGAVYLRFRERMVERL